jgi:hypothetical protein
MTNPKKLISLLVDVVELVLDVDDVDEVLLVEVVVVVDDAKEVLIDYFV